MDRPNPKFCISELVDIIDSDGILVKPAVEVLNIQRADGRLYRNTESGKQFEFVGYMYRTTARPFAWTPESCLRKRPDLHVPFDLTNKTVNLWNETKIIRHAEAAGMGREKLTEHLRRLKS